MIRCGIVHREPGSLTPEDARLLGRMVEAVADDFLPSLAMRTSTTQKSLSSPTAGSVDAYLTGMLAQHTLLAWANDGSLAAFLSFRLNHVDPRFAGLGASAYVSTIAVMPQFRREGFARRLYAALLQLPLGPSRLVLLRTWGSNVSHLDLLAEIGFEILARDIDNRGPGVDTVYLGIPLGGRRLVAGSSRLVG